MGACKTGEPDAAQRRVARSSHHTEIRIKAMVPVYTEKRVEKSSITPVNSRFTHSVHQYHAVMPWSQDMTHLLYIGFDSEEEASIVVQRLADGKEHVLAQTTLFNYHDCAGQHWIFDDRAVVFRDKDAKGDGVLSIVYLERPGVVEKLTELPDCGIRHVCADQRHALGMRRSSEKTGGSIERIDLQERTSETLVTVAEAVETVPEPLYTEFIEDTASFHINHPVYNRQETRLFFKLMRRFADGTGQFGAFFVKDLESGDLRCFGREISGHPCWMPDGRAILNIASPQGYDYVRGEGFKSGDGSGNRWVVVVDAQTGEYERLVDQPIEGPGHPDISPDGNWVVTDAFTADAKKCPIYVIEIKTGIVREIARLDHKSGGRSVNELTRGQPHPSWSPDSKQVLVNCNHGGRGIQPLILHDFLP